MPTLFRDDYVHNGNDSHWLTNPEEPITGDDRIIGIEDAERTYRTRIGLIQIEERLAGTDGLPGKGFDRSSLQKVALGNRQYLGELWRDDLVSLLRLGARRPAHRLQRPVDVSGACEPLATGTSTTTSTRTAPSSSAASRPTSSATSNACRPASRARPARRPR